jgi:precorrin-3B C17-methyltransferase
VVGIGPGSPLDRTRRAEQAIADSSVVVGYKRYLEHIADLTAGKELITSGMRQEVERCRAAVRRAADGATVALISSGDAGVYGMAGLAIELAAAEGLRVAIEIVPGVTAASAAAARLGAPLMLDFAAISLSDLLVDWATIRRRLEAAAAADLVVALYNPRSSQRVRQFAEAVDIFRRHRPPSTPVGLGVAVGDEDERIVLTDLAGAPDQEVDMRTVVIIGNSTSRVIDGWFVTARGYRTGRE